MNDPLINADLDMTQGSSVLASPVPPAGDVEVKRYSFKGAAGLYVYEGDFTRLTAERDGLLKEVASLQALVNQDLQQLEQMESELTKARELLTDMLKDDDIPAHWFAQRINEILDAHQSAPAAKVGE